MTISQPQFLNILLLLFNHVLLLFLCCSNHLVVPALVTKPYGFVVAHCVVSPHHAKKKKMLTCLHHSQVSVTTVEGLGLRLVLRHTKRYEELKIIVVFMWILCCRTNINI